MNQPGLRNDRSVEQSGVSRKNRSANLGNQPGFLCQNPANKNSTDFQLGTDDTKGYRGAPKHEGCIYMLQSEFFSHFINVGVCDVACVRCFVHMHES